MQFCEWEPVYTEILKDLGFERSADEASAKLLKMLTLNSNIISEDDLEAMITEDVSIVGGNVSAGDIVLLKQISKDTETLISAGSATDLLVSNDIIPDIAVTDLDGDVELQKKASSLGAVTMIHAHGDNTHLVIKHTGGFNGPVIITTQSRPDRILCNFGGFTDGDRSVCVARHFGAKRIRLIGFDMDTPADKKNTDPEMKRKKLEWAKKVIFDMNPREVTIIMS
ncbi:MAG: DUF115 domain-containing protein [Methanomassiliicoccaceae archaeon]|nr:DUF115 domain-containing protein [Methanomassiliicoccaceae archaeon]